MHTSNMYILSTEYFKNQNNSKWKCYNTNNKNQIFIDYVSCLCQIFFNPRVLWHHTDDSLWWKKITIRKQNDDVSSFLKAFIILIKSMCFCGGIRTWVQVPVEIRCIRFPWSWEPSNNMGARNLTPVFCTSSTCS